MIANVQETTLQLEPGSNLMANVSFWKVFTATIIKELQVMGRYLPNLIGNILQILIRVLFFFMLANFASYSGTDMQLSGKNLFIFFTGGILLWMFNNTALSAPLNAVQQDLYNGTLEYLYSSPISRYAYYLGTTVSTVIFNMVFFVPLFVFFIVYTRPNPADILTIFLVCFTAIVGLTAFGIMIALMGLLWRQIGAVAGVLGLLFEFVAGAYLPVSKFPLPIKYFAYILPHTWGFDLVRYYSLNKKWQTLEAEWVEWAVLIAYGVFYTALSFYLLKKVEKQAKKSGLNLL